MAEKDKTQPPAEVMQSDADAKEKIKDLEVAIAELTQRNASLEKAVADKAMRGETPAWQKAEYTGPLTAEQAAFRNQRYIVKANNTVSAPGFKLVNGVAIEDAK
jgi:hypothetical protein